MSLAPGPEVALSLPEQFALLQEVVTSEDAAKIASRLALNELPGVFGGNIMQGQLLTSPQTVVPQRWVPGAIGAVLQEIPDDWSFSRTLGVMCYPSEQEIMRVEILADSAIPSSNGKPLHDLATVHLGFRLNLDVSPTSRRCQSYGIILRGVGSVYFDAQGFLTLDGFTMDERAILNSFQLAELGAAYGQAIARALNITHAQLLSGRIDPIATAQGILNRPYAQAAAAGQPYSPVAWKS